MLLERLQRDSLEKDRKTLGDRGGSKGSGGPAAGL